MSDPSTADAHLNQTLDPQQGQNLPHPQDYSQMHPTDRLQQVMQPPMSTPNMSQSTQTADPATANVSPATAVGVSVGTIQDQNLDENDPSISMTHQIGQTQDSSQVGLQPQAMRDAPIPDGTLSESDKQQIKPGLPAGMELVGGDKERVEIRPTVAGGEKAPVMEVREHERVPEDVQSWIEELEDANEIQIAEPITDDGNVILDNSVAFKDDKIVLPITQTSVQQGMKQQVVESARWLAEWCTRLMKMLGDKVQYKQE